ERVLTGLTSENTAAVVVSLAAVVIAVVQLYDLWRIGAIAGALGLLLCTPMLLSLPLLDVGSYGLQWAGQLLIGLGVFLLALGVRGRVRTGVRQVLVPFVDRNLGRLIVSGSEEQEEARQEVLRDAADALVDVAY